MEKYIYDEKIGLWYKLQGDYYIPCLKLPDEEQRPIGIWDQRHLRYLRQHRRVTYTNLLTSGKLTEHLLEIEQAARSRMEQITAQMARAEGVTEELKATDQMKWVGLMNSIRQTAEETVLTELIYN